MAKRLFDLLVAAIALVVLAPVFLCAAVGICLSSPGPILYRARRVGRNGRPFTMYKFRTMRVEQGPNASPITASNDPRVFRFGSLLRRLKIDELPQLVNILIGQMTIVGPRPEDPEIVRKYYTPAQWETLRVLPGLACPGSLYDYTHGERQLNGSDLLGLYGGRLLLVKLALDTVYVRDASLLYDVNLICRTAWTILCIALGRRAFPPPREMKKALALGLLSPDEVCLSNLTSTPLKTLENSPQSNAG